MVYKADDHLKEKWKRVQNNTSTELLALCKDHILKLLEKTAGKMHEVEKQIEDSKNEEVNCMWEELRRGNQK